MLSQSLRMNVAGNDLFFTDLLVAYFLFAKGFLTDLFLTRFLTTKFHRLGFRWSDREGR